METTELNGTQAARWVWDSLWSTRRHARMNIIDVAILEDGATEASPTPTGMRWLFTAKDGRVMKKSSHNSNLGALKQAFLSRGLLRRGSSSAADATRDADNGSGSRSAGDGGGCSSATGGVFATALLSSGESVPLDEAGWAALIAQESGRGKGAVAVTALAPAGGDPATENSRRGGPTQQRYFCEYKAKPYSSSSSSKSGTNIATGDLSRASTKPIQTALTTYVLVSRGLLRDSPESIVEPREHHEGETNKLSAPRAATALSDERLVSRVKAINREVEAKLRHVVQWVQEVRRVHVLSIAATFIVVPSLGRGAGTAGVWLEQALHARIVSKNGEVSVALGASEPAPYAEPRGMIPPSPILTSENSQPGPTPLVPIHQNHDRGLEAREAPLTEAVSNSPEETVSMADTAVPAASESGSPASPAPLPSTTTPSSAERLGAKVQQSTAEMLSAAADAVLLSADPPSATTTAAAAASPLEAASQDRHLRDGERGSVKRSLVVPGRQRGERRSLLIGTESEEAAASTPTSAPSYARPLRERCSGDFCAYGNCGGGVRPGPPERPPPETIALELNEGDRDGGGESPAAELNWTSIGVSDDRRSGAALLEFTDKQQQQQLPSSSRESSERDPRAGKEMLFSLTFKSVGLAREEAKQGLDVYWGEALQRCWREGNGRGVRGLEELSPALVYREVAVCRACYEVYRRLDKLRERGGGRTADAAGDRGSSSSSSSSLPLPLPSSKGRKDSLAGIDATASSGRRAAAAEAGAATLREEVGEMLKDVDARAGKPGVEAGIPWRRRLSKSKSSAGGRADQSRLVDKLSQPKKQQLNYPLEEERHTLPRHDHTTRRPTLKRQVKSQGDIPDSADDDAGDCRHPPQRRTSAPVPGGGGGFPSLPRARRRRQESAAAVRGAPWQRTILPRGGAPRQSAWPPLRDEDGGGAFASDHHANPFRRDLEGGGGGGGRSRETICAIEAMLEEGGGDSYLPARARDLPEALAVLGPPKPESSSKEKARGGAERKKLRHRGAGKKSGQEPKLEDNGHDTGEEENDPTSRDALEASAENGSTGRSRNDPGPNTGGEGETRKPPPGWPSVKPERAEERFLHPWQRALEANKRAVNARTGGQHEAALLEEQRCRREARRAAAESMDCRRAGRRVAARLGRQHGRRRRRRSGKSRGHGKGDRKTASDRPEGSEDRARLNGRGCEVGSRERVVDLHRRGDDEDDDDFLRQLRDALGWARKTLEALVKRLKDRGIAVESARVTAASGGGVAKDWEIVRVLNKLRRRLAAFEDEGISLGVNKATAAEEGVAAAAEARSRCEAACESFETDFCHLIDELTATAKGIPSHPDLQLCSASVTLRASESSGSVPPGPGGAAASDAASRTVFGPLSLGLCPSCSVLPVARRCLDCDGDDRDRCSSCFVREHRDADRQRHRFLRISGCGRGGSGTVAGCPPRVASAVEKGAMQEDSSGGGVRCSRCGDLAAARRCRDCRVDMCAACHFLAHRSPSRRSHVTEFVGETAVSMQEALHSRNRGTAAAGSAAARGSREDGGEVVAKDSGASCSSSPFSSPSSPQEFRNVGDSGSDRVDAVSREAREGHGGESPVPGESSFGKGAIQSLAQVRRTIDAPAVPPPGPSQSLGGTGPPGFCGPTENFYGVGGEREHASRDDARPIDEDPSVEVGAGGFTSLTGGDDGVHPTFEPPGDGFVEEEAGIPNSAGSPDEVIHRDGAGHYGGGRWNGWDEQGRDKRGNGDVEIPEEITGGDGEHGPSDTATHSRDIKDDGRSRDILRAGAGGGGEGADMTEAMFGGLEGIEEEEELEGEETDTSSEETSDDDDDDDEGMMWSPVNIAKVVVPDTALDGEEAEKHSPPFTSRAVRTPDELDDVPATPREGEDGGNSQAARTPEANTPKMIETPRPDDKVTASGAIGKRREEGTSSPPPPPPATPKSEAATGGLHFALGSRKGNEEQEGHGDGGGGGDASPKRMLLLLQTGAPKDEAAEREQDGSLTPPPPGGKIAPRAGGPERTDHQETVQSARPSPLEAISQNSDTSAVEADESNCR